MRITADVFDNSRNWIDHLEAGTIIGLFRIAQYRYGHCLGKLFDKGDIVGWRFARCMGEEMCSRVEVVNVKVNEEV